jgi:hypothetical protein
MQLGGMLSMKQGLETVLDPKQQIVGSSLAHERENPS